MSLFLKLLNCEEIFINSDCHSTRQFNVRRFLAFDARLASIHLLQLPRRSRRTLYAPDPSPRPLRRHKRPQFIPSPNFEYIWSVIYALRFHFVGISFRSGPLMVLCFIYLCLWLFKQFIILMHTQARPARWCLASVSVD